MGDGLTGVDRRDAAHRRVSKFVERHPLITILLAAGAATAFIPLVAFVALLLFSASICVGAGALFLTVTVVIPALFCGAILYLCYSAGRMAYGLVVRGQVGSGNQVLLKPEAQAQARADAQATNNRVMMKPEARATGNEARGHLELNLIKMEGRVESDETGDSRKPTKSQD